MTIEKFPLGARVRVVPEEPWFTLTREGVVTSTHPDTKNDYLVTFSWDRAEHAFYLDHDMLEAVSDEFEGFERTEAIEEGVTLPDDEPTIARKYNNGFEFDQPTTHTRKVITYVGPWEAK